MAWVSDRTGVETGMPIPLEVVIPAISEWIVNESLADLLAEHGWTPDDKARNSAPDQLLAAGIDPEDARLPTYIGWQAVRARAASGGGPMDLGFELRFLDLKKHPSVTETLDWARTLVLLGIDKVDAQTATETVNILLKYRTDIDKAVKEFADNPDDLVPDGA